MFGNKLKRYVQEDAFDKLCHSPKGKYTVGYITLPCSKIEYEKKAEATKIMFVLEGEMDVYVKGMNIRLSKNNWINIPKGIDYSIRVYRSKTPCTFFSVSTFDDCKEKKLNFGNLEDLPKYKDMIAYFGQESQVMQGMFLAIHDTEHFDAELENESFIFCYSGEIKVFTKREMIVLEKGEFAFPKRKQRFTVSGMSKDAEFMIFSSPIDKYKVDLYESWLKDEYNINWAEGAVNL